MEIGKHKNRNRFVLTHPIAGTEESGASNAFAEMLSNKNAIICDREDTDRDAFDTVVSLYESMGMSVITMESKDHDLHCAYISHISHISSFVLGKTVLDIESDDKGRIFEMAGSGFNSTVRLAKSISSTWVPIFIENRQNIVKAIDAYMENLSNIKDMILNSDSENIKGFIDKSNKSF